MRIIIEMDGASPVIRIEPKTEATGATAAPTTTTASMTAPATYPSAPTPIAAASPYTGAETGTGSEEAFDGGGAPGQGMPTLEPATATGDPHLTGDAGYAVSAGAAPDPAEAMVIDMMSQEETAYDEDLIMEPQFGGEPFVPHEFT